MLIRAAISGRSSSLVAAHLSTVSSRSLAALPLPTVPQPQVIQYRKNVDYHIVLMSACISVSLVSPGHLHTHRPFLCTVFHMAIDQPGLLPVSRSLGIMGYK